EPGSQKSCEVPPWERRDHKCEEGPGGNRQTESHANGCRGNPRKWKRNGDVRRNGYPEESLVPPARRFRSLPNFEEYSCDYPWKTKWNKEPTDSTVPRICEIKAGNDRQGKHYYRKAVYRYDFTPKVRRRAIVWEPVSGTTSLGHPSPDDKSGHSEDD